MPASNHGTGLRFKFVYSSFGDFVPGASFHADSSLVADADLSIISMTTEATTEATTMMASDGEKIVKVSIDHGTTDQGQKRQFKEAESRGAIH
jgi:hypothetical protein